MLKLCFWVRKKIKVCDRSDISHLFHIKLLILAYEHNKENDKNFICDKQTQL